MASRSTAPRIKNRAPAPIQISAEQILREAHERQEQPLSQTRTRIEDYEELSEVQGRKRKEFEDVIRRTRSNISAWMKYAAWEASQGELARSRSVFERALDVEPSNVPLWLRYTETELKNRNVQHARNLFDRAVSILPRVDTLWYKYVHLEELLGNVSGARQIFERWMSWEPDEKAWAAYVGLEVRYNEMERASNVWERAVTCHPEPRQWIKWAKFEEDRAAYDRARQVFTMALEFFGEDEDRMEKAQTVYTAFAKMETRVKEYDRARVIYKYALERLPRSKSSGIYSSYTRFEKQFGTREGVEDTVLGKRRIQYEEELTSGPGAASNYDTWFDYTRLEEDAYRTLTTSGASTESKEVLTARSRVRDVYERAVANVPPSSEKRHWRRYIFLWLSYALFEEIDTKDYDRAREVYKAAIALVPHRSFTFAKLWLNFAHFEVRRLDLPAARKVLGAAIGMCPKERLFKGYIDLELSLKEFDRARKIYERALDWDAGNARIWIRFAELERNLYDEERARAIFDLGTRQAGVDMPEVLWKAYIDFEFEERQWDKVEELYERLLQRTGHVKVWISYALSQIQSAIAEEEHEDEKDDEDEEEDQEGEGAEKESVPLTESQLLFRQERREKAKVRTRELFERGYKDLKSRGLKEERVVLLEAWKAFEAQHGATAAEIDSAQDANANANANANLKAVEARMPRVVKKRRAVQGVNAEEGGAMEEYYDMIFPDDDEGKSKQSFKLLAMAHAWRAAQQQQQQQQAQVQIPGEQESEGEEGEKEEMSVAEAAEAHQEEAQDVEVGPAALDADADADADVDVDANADGAANGSSDDDDDDGNHLHPGLGTAEERERNAEAMDVGDEDM
ncbi:TPR-like protein [Microstroma glucosiphilum]|uniref:TPR-like protein n=1 Tax=Pseudomicrostroma glucosiphilum TaxID=1684307 RepID=A0A316UCQ7_9BASI|nr:TPR-like protein [Pseudomicrostroma glucosiphilum]PWN23017.1 TPR-like protein [Pseudomicrostroma glucosiphilum]